MTAIKEKQLFIKEVDKIRKLGNCAYRNFRKMYFVSGEEAYKTISTISRQLALALRTLYAQYGDKELPAYLEIVEGLLHYFTLVDDVAEEYNKGNEDEALRLATEVAREVTEVREMFRNKIKKGTIVVQKSLREKIKDKLFSFFGIS